MNNCVAQFTAAIEAAGIPRPDKITANGKLHRFATNGKHGDDSGWFVLHTDGLPAGAFGCWRAGISQTWRADIGRDLTPAENQAHRVRMNEIQAARDADTAQRHADAAIRASALWQAAQKASPDHPYLRRKGVQPHGLRLHNGALVIPMSDTDGELRSLQFIGPDGSKKFLPGGRVKACFHMIGEPDGALAVCEGVATGMSIHAATGHAVAVAFNSGNLERVARALRAKHPDAKLIICGDADKSGAGQKAAAAAANAVGGVVALPEFTAAEMAAEKTPSDLNDLAQLRGLEAVAGCIEKVLAAPDADEDNPGADIQPREAQSPPPVPVAEDFDATVARLAALKPHEYDKSRAAAAKRLGVRAATLDDAAKALRARQTGGAAALFPDVVPWPEAVDGAALLDEIAATVRRFVACDQSIADAVALWITFTWLIDSFAIAPILMISAPDKECGKTTLLNLIARMVRRPLPASNISSAAIFRVIEAEGPTLLLDEVDTYLKENEEARGVINSGHTRDSAFVIRLVGDNHEPKRFFTFGAKALCGIGKLAATIESRSLIVEMRRKMPGEKIEQMRFAGPELFTRLASQLARFAHDAGEAIGQMRPSLPQSLGDRAQDNAEPLLAIADYAGGGWPQRARAAILKIAGAAAEADNLRGGLLQDIQTAFTASGADRLSTADLLAALIADQTLPYATYARGKPMTARHLANRLASYRIAPRTIRIGNATPKGFLLADFADVFARYLSFPPDTPILSATPPQPAETLDFFDNPAATGDTGVADRKPPNTLKTNDCCGVADKNPLSGTEVCFDGADSETEVKL